MIDTNTIKERTPFVSVIMPVYNVGLYIKEAIDSIITQTFHDFEFIIIDDASTDNTWNIIQSYRDSRIISFKNKNNLGNYPSRNEGIKIAKGKYIAVMDGDDVAMPERLESQMKIMEGTQNLLAHGTAFVFSNGQKSLIPYSYETIKVALLKNNMFLHPSLMIRKEVFDLVGYYSDDYHYSSDYDLVCKIAKNGEIINTPDILMQYRVHSNQISSIKKAEQTNYAKKIRLEYLKKCGFILSEKEEMTFTMMMTEERNICLSDAILVADKIINKNLEIDCFNRNTLNKFLKGALLSIIHRK